MYCISSISKVFYACTKNTLKDGEKTNPTNKDQQKHTILDSSV